MSARGNAPGKSRVWNICPARATQILERKSNIASPLQGEFILGHLFLGALPQADMHYSFGVNSHKKIHFMQFFVPLFLRV